MVYKFEYLCQRFFTIVLDKFPPLVSALLIENFVITASHFFISVPVHQFCREKVKTRKCLLHLNRENPRNTFINRKSNARPEDFSLIFIIETVHTTSLKKSKYSKLFPQKSSLNSKKFKDLYHN